MRRGWKRSLRDAVPRLFLAAVLLSGMMLTWMFFLAFAPILWIADKFEKPAPPPTDWRK